ncbi:MAG: peptidase M23 [Desulfobacterales bacterium]|nr:MAG: peptidase M23 [Desulfobacterales bacterium]
MRSPSDHRFFPRFDPLISRSELTLLAGAALIVLMTVILAVLAFSGLAFAGTGSETSGKRTRNPANLAELYGLDGDLAQARRDVVKKHQNLADILLREGVGYGEIQEAVNQCRPFFDVRKIRAGNPYCILKNAAGETEYFVYEKNSVDYLVFALGREVDVMQRQKPVHLIPRKAEGRIETSLLAAFARQGLDDSLAVKLSDIYAWTLDFHHLQKGDSFRIIYEEKRIFGRTVGHEKILGAVIRHRGEAYYALSYEKDGRLQYFDETGGSLRKAFLKAPLKYTRISSGYTMRRFHPVLKYYRPHLGIDYAAPAGTPIMSVGDGVVTQAGYSKTMGRYVEIRHSGKYKTRYLHCSRIDGKTRIGSRVRQGDVIAYVGATGLATGPHLDFRFWDDGKPVNFLKHKLPAADPVAEKDLPAFRAAVAPMLHQLMLPAFKKIAARLSRAPSS